MKYVRYGAPGEERPGLIDDGGHIRDLSSHLADIDGDILAGNRLASIAGMSTENFDVVPGRPRLGPPVGKIGKVVAAGLNYAAHAREAKMEVPDEPVLFSKATSSLSGPNDAIVLPKGSVKGDWEVELAVVIGKRAQYVSEETALDHVAGYTIMNDVSERAYQLETTGQWLKGKSFDTFAPLGPWLVTADEVPDPQNLRLWLKLNGEMMQDGNTKTMIAPVATLIMQISRYMTLEPGDVVATGTPPGVGLGRTPPVYLKPGDVLELGVEGLGQQRQEVKAWPE